MKKIEAIVRPEKFEIIKDALIEEGHGGMSVAEIKGQGSNKGVSQVWHGKSYRIDLLPMTKIDLVVPDDNVEQAVETIIDIAKTGSIGDGKIFISEISNVHRIRTGEQGDAAV